MSRDPWDVAAAFFAGIGIGIASAMALVAAFDKPACPSPQKIILEVVRK